MQSKLGESCFRERDYGREKLKKRELTYVEDLLGLGSWEQILYEELTDTSALVLVVLGEVGEEYVRVEIHQKNKIKQLYKPTLWIFI